MILTKRNQFCSFGRKFNFEDPILDMDPYPCITWYSGQFESINYSEELKMIH